MRFNPLSQEEAEAQSSNLWEDGIYDYEVREATEKTSNSGNEMIELETWIFDKDGKRKLLFAYLVSSEKAAWKVREFASSCGLLEAYDTGTLMASEIVGRTGVCEVGTQPARDGYQAKNVIRTWCHREKSKPAPSPARPANARTKSLADDLDDVVPF
jgi:hypothetical protein